MRWILFLLLLAAPALAQSMQQTAPASAPSSSHTMCAAYYPASAVLTHAQGTTKVEFMVTAQGTVTNVVVKSSSGHADLDQASVRCVERWLYPPTTQNGTLLDVPKQVNVTWSLDRPDPGPDPVLFMVEGAVQECIGKDRPRDDVLAKATGMTVVKVQFGNDRPPSVDVTTSSGSAELDKLVVDCLGQLHPPIRSGFIIPFSWKADAPASPPGPSSQTR